MISITIDTEWCEPEVIEDTLNLLKENNVEATLFSTHDDGLPVSHERALHPNFLSENASEDKVMEDISELYPEAVGTRSHSLYVHSGVRDTYPDRIRYESNYISYLKERIEPFWMLDEIVQIPVFFMDDMWLRTRSSDDPEIKGLVEGSGVRVFDFHPIHIYLNTPTIDYYSENQKYYHNPSKLMENRYEGFGARNLFENLLSEIDKRGLNTYTMADIANKYKRENPYSEVKL